MTKTIIMNFENGMIYGVPLEFIAKHRAREYEQEGTEEFEHEVQYVMNDSYEGIDWLQNNMNWEDIEKVAFKIVSTAPVDYNYQFRNAECRIAIEKTGGNNNDNETR